MLSPTDRKKQLQRDQRNYKKHLKEVERKNKFQKNSKRQENEHRFRQNHQNRIFKSRKESFFQRYGVLITPESGEEHIEIPENFCLCTNYATAFSTIKIFASSIYDYLGSPLTLDFSKCKRADTAALFLLQIIRLEMIGIVEDLQERFPALFLNPDIKVSLSKTPDVVRLLITTGYPVDIEAFNQENREKVTMQPIDHMGFFRGNSKQQEYRENRKPVVAKKVVDYLNKCLDRYGYELREDDKNSTEGIIGEVLSNAEDHSSSDTWFITSNFSGDISEGTDKMVGELNIAIANFGHSFYEAFESTKIKNHEQYNQVESLVQRNREKNPTMKFGDEQLYTLVMMSETISRLKYKEDSRGTGTIKFLRSFGELGDFENKANGYMPNLSLFTGHTHLICDNELKPFAKDTVYCLSLNPEKDLTVPPRESHLKILPEKFPGTLLSVKIYLNKQHLDKKYGGNQNDN